MMLQDQSVGPKAIIGSPLWNMSSTPLPKALCGLGGTLPGRQGTTMTRHRKANRTPSCALDLGLGTGSPGGSAVHTTIQGLSPSSDGTARVHGRLTALWSLLRGQAVPTGDPSLAHLSQISNCRQMRT